jgi:hypothetical protein
MGRAGCRRPGGRNAGDGRPPIGGGWEETARTAMEIEAGHPERRPPDRRGAARGDPGDPFPAGPPGGGADRARERRGPGARGARVSRRHGEGPPFRRGQLADDSGGDRGKREDPAPLSRDRRRRPDAWEAVRSGEAGAAGRAIAREWEIRKTLASGVSPARVEKTFALQEFRKRVAGVKLCGAGGGGMACGLLRAPEERGRVEALLTAEGFAVYPFTLSGGPRVVR